MAAGTGRHRPPLAGRRADASGQRLSLRSNHVHPPCPVGLLPDLPPPELAVGLLLDRPLPELALGLLADLPPPELAAGLLLDLLPPELA